MSIVQPTTAGTSAVPHEPARTASSRLLFWGGALLIVAVIGAYIAQVSWARALFTPWYLPVGATVGALMVLFAAARRGGWWRWLVAAACAVMAAFEWTFVVALSALPAYSGSIAEGQAMPKFNATLADGTPIDESYFGQHAMTALVLFQGRWCPFCMTELRELDDNAGKIASAGGHVLVMSIENPETAAETQRDFPSLAVASDEQRELTGALDAINPGFAPDGQDCALPTVLLVDREGIVRWIHRPSRFIERPGSTELMARISAARTKSYAE